MLASTFVFGGVQALKNTPALAAKSKPVNDSVRGIVAKVAPQVKVPADDKTLVRINAGVQILAGLGLATNRVPRLSALALATSVVPTTAAGHPFWTEKDKTARATQQSQFFKNLSMLGGLVLAAVDTNGKPGVAWRATRAVGSVGKSVKRSTPSATKSVAAGKSAKSVAKAAKASARSAAKSTAKSTAKAAKANAKSSRATLKSVKS